MPLLAEEIVEQCKVIHHSKLPLVQELVFKLQQRSIEEATVEVAQVDPGSLGLVARRRSDDDYDNTNGSGDKTQIVNRFKGRRRTSKMSMVHGAALR